MAEDFRITQRRAKPGVGDEGVRYLVRHSQGSVRVSFQNYDPRVSVPRAEETVVIAYDPNRPELLTTDTIRPPLDLGPSQEAREHVGAVAVAAARAVVLKLEALGVLQAP
jgi:hypothetical protein